MEGFLHIFDHLHTGGFNNAHLCFRSFFKLKPQRVKHLCSSWCERAPVEGNCSAEERAVQLHGEASSFTGSTSACV